MPLRLLAIFLTILSPLTAQEKAEKKPDEKGLQVKFLAEVAPDSLGKVMLVFGEAKSKPFNLTVSQLSAPVPATARAMVLKTVDKEVPLCTISLPEEGKSFAVILVTAKPAGYSPIIVRTDDPTFKAGDVVFINRSEKVVLGKLGDTPLVLKAGEVKKSRPTGPKENAFYDIAFATREEGGDKLMSSTRWPIDNLLRSYVFFFTNAEEKTTFRAVDEYMTPPVTAKP